ncbi:esterase [Viridibacterium curvum]|uniref:Esterase n=1 Tax=Viridibacterium curvum TaxID=1101404 RepID=A0ABP9QTG2_9RHOO
MNGSLIVQQAAAHAQQLILLFHGVGASPEGMVPLGEALAAAHPQAFVVAVRAAHASDLGRGYQWFSVAGISEEHRPQRIAQAMPLFVDTVQHWQKRSGASSENTTLVGFSQGAIMSLEASQLGEPLASRIVSLSGRFAVPPRRAPAAQLHFIHGEQDGVIPPQFAVNAVEQLRALDATPTLDLIPALAHGIDQRVRDTLLARLSAA